MSDKAYETLQLLMTLVFIGFIWWSVTRGPRR